MTIRGEMIHRLQLKKRENQVNDANEILPNPTWSDVTKCWARITPISGNEYNEADKQNAKITHIIDIWNIKALTSAIKADMRFYNSMDGMVYNIDTYLKQMVQRDRIISCRCILDDSRPRLEGE